MYFLYKKSKTSSSLYVMSLEQPSIYTMLPPLLPPCLIDYIRSLTQMNCPFATVPPGKVGTIS